MDSRERWSSPEKYLSYGQGKNYPDIPVLKKPIPFNFAGYRMNEMERTFARPIWSPIPTLADSGRKRLDKNQI
jgi:hypothetical protein